MRFVARDLHRETQRGQVQLDAALELLPVLQGAGRVEADHLLRIGWEVRCTLCMQVRSQEFGVVANGDVQVFVYLGHAPLDPWARFLCDRALFFETIA